MTSQVSPIRGRDGTGIPVLASLALWLLLAPSTLAQYTVPESTKPGPSFAWPEGKRVAVSLTFDDARLSQIDNGLPLFRKHGVKATFYVSPSNVPKRLDGWKTAVAEGHEIGNHTVQHPCTGNFAFARHKALEDYTLETMGRDLDEANERIQRMLGVEAVDFAYPCGQTFVGRGPGVKSYVPLVAEKFLTGRLWLSEDANDPAFCDPSQLLGMESDGKNFEQLKELVERAAARGGWLVLCGHEIASEGGQTTRLRSLNKLCEYMGDPKNGVWVDTVEAVGKYVLGQR